ncbi:TonB-dependent receptor [uncultured Polaribacter sp.]|uniref:TonB-dependent receptor n=1 Tax=uncultured Polaribacter sp. TaxID=174711 RepID=UPI00263449D1|nr:TonB-dependent receptor [uncultured Polaribacter sp.]
MRVFINLLKKSGNFFIAIFFWALSISSFAQETSLSGKVVDIDGTPLSGAHISIIALQKSTVTGTSGNFKMTKVPVGNHSVKISFLGYKSLDKKIVLEKGQPLKLTFTMEEETETLDDVTIIGKSKSQKLRESVASVAVLNTKELYTQNNNTSDVIKQISGVNVRQTGGFGSSAEVFINGMSGKQVKFFLDGIPLSYYGSGLGLNVIPVNLMEQIEVYKGVVPVDLGADALGGGINIILRKSYSDYLDVSYSLGSFNTHKANVNGQYVNSKNHTLLGINSFYNHSDNNYKVDVEIPDEFGNPNPATVKRFHDKFSNYMFNLYAGVYDKPYADRLIVNTRYSGLDDEVQHNAIMAQPYGEVTYDENTLGVSVTYEKKEILSNTGIKWYGGVNKIEGHFKDLSLNAYTWDGKVYDTRPSGGEISSSRNSLDLTSKNAVSRLNVKYNPWEKGKFTFNIFTAWFHRVGKDPIAAAFYGEDYYANPTKLFKNAIGLAYEHTFKEKITSYTAIKHFMLDADGYAIENLNFLPNKQSASNFGVSQSFKYQIASNILAKASYEYATRLPDEFELFGDFTLVRPNPFLKPEQSHNANIGMQWNTSKIKLGLHTFYRLTDNVIWLRTSQFFAQYQNLLKSLTKGVEAELAYQLYDFLRLKINATYQDLRNRSPKNVTGTIDDRYFNARLPNIPYLFGNGEIRYQKDNFLGSKNKFSTWWTANYVNEYFLFWDVDGNKDFKNVIPSQFIQNVGVSYAFPQNRFSVSLEAANVFDKKAFDNFNVQRPGRAFYITLRTFFK